MEEERRRGANQISGKWGSVVCRRYSTPSEHSLCLFRNCYYWLWHHCVCFASFILAFTLPSLSSLLLSHLPSLLPLLCSDFHLLFQIYRRNCCTPKRGSHQLCILLLPFLLLFSSSFFSCYSSLLFFSPSPLLSSFDLPKDICEGCSRKKHLEQLTRDICFHYHLPLWYTPPLPSPLSSSLFAPLFHSLSPLFPLSLSLLHFARSTNWSDDRRYAATR